MRFECVPGFTEVRKILQEKLRSNRRTTRRGGLAKSSMCRDYATFDPRQTRGNSTTGACTVPAGRQFSGIVGYPTQMHERTKGTNRDSVYGDSTAARVSTRHMPKSSSGDSRKAGCRLISG